MPIIKSRTSFHVCLENWLNFLLIMDWIIKNGAFFLQQRRDWWHNQGGISAAAGCCCCCKDVFCMVHNNPLLKIPKKDRPKTLGCRFFVTCHFLNLSKYSQIIATNLFGSWYFWEEKRWPRISNHSAKNCQTSYAK